MLSMSVSVIWLFFLSFCTAVTANLNTTAASNTSSADSPPSATALTVRQSIQFVTVDPSTGLCLSDSSSATQPLSTGTGLQYASQCNSAKISWELASGSGTVGTSTFTTTITNISNTLLVSFTTTTSLAPGATPYTLCDGYTRIDGTTSVSAYGTVSNSTSITVFRTATPIVANVSAPTCIIGSSDCSYLQSSYTLASNAALSFFDVTESYAEQSLTYTGTQTSPPGPSESLPPICGTAPPITPPPLTSDGSPTCATNTARVQLLYWPVTTDSGCDLCKQDQCVTLPGRATIPGRPNSVVTLNTTLTSPTVYIAFYAGPSSSSLFPQSSDSISSYCAGPGGTLGAPMSFDYANLNTVPASAYRCQQKCFETPYSALPNATNYLGFKTLGANTVEYATVTQNLCSTIWNDYNPILSLPSDISSQLVPVDEQGCDFLPNGSAVLFDPPKALTMADEVSNPTSLSFISANPTTLAQPTHAAMSQPQPASKSSPAQVSPTSALSAPSTQTSEPEASLRSVEGSRVQQSPAPLQSTLPPNNRQSRAPQPSDSSPGVGGIIASILGISKPDAQSTATAGASASTAGGSNSNGGSSGSSTTGDSGESGFGSESSGNKGSGSGGQGPSESGSTGGSQGSEGLESGSGSENGAAGNGNNQGSAQEGGAGSNSINVAPAAVILTNIDDSITATIVQATGANAAVIGSNSISAGHTTDLPGFGDVAVGSSGIIIGTDLHAFSTGALDDQTAVGVVLQSSNGQTITVTQASVTATTSIAGVGNIVFGTSGVVVDGTTHAFSALPGTSAAVSSQGSQLVVAPGETFKPGEAVTVSGTTLPFGSAGTAAVVNGDTHSVASSGSTGASTGSAVGSAATQSSGNSGSVSASSSQSRPTDSQASSWKTQRMWSLLSIPLAFMYLI